MGFLQVLIRELKGSWMVEDWEVVWSGKIIIDEPASIALLTVFLFALASFEVVCMALQSLTLNTTWMCLLLGTICPLLNIPLAFEEGKENCYAIDGTVWSIPFHDFQSMERNKY